MAYLFKDSIKERIEESTIYVSDRVFDELDEVYRKAKAFDEIVNILKDTHSNAYDDLEDIQLIINEYREDK